MNLTQSRGDIKSVGGETIYEDIRFLETTMTHPKFGDVSIKVPLGEDYPDLKDMAESELGLIHERVQEAFDLQIAAEEQKRRVQEF